MLHIGLAQPQAACAIPALEPSMIVGSQFFCCPEHVPFIPHGPTNTLKFHTELPYSFPTETPDFILETFPPRLFLALSFASQTAIFAAASIGNLVRFLSYPPPSAAFVSAQL